MDIYFNSVGKGGGMNLGVAPDRDGYVCDADIKSLDGFGSLLKSLYSDNFAKGAVVTASAVRSGDDKISYDAANVIDGDRYTYWATNDDVKQGELILTLPKESEFDVVRLRENIKLGQWMVLLSMPGRTVHGKSLLKARALVPVVFFAAKK